MTLRRFFIPVAVFFVTAGFGFAGFFIAKHFFPLPAKPEGPEMEPVVLSYWGTSIPEEVMNPLISQYQKTHPLTQITYTKRSFDDVSEYKATLLTRLQEKSGPQIFRVHSTWIPEYIGELSFFNKAIVLDEFKERFYPIAERQCVTKNSDILCVPLMYDGLVVLYNKDMFEVEGLGVPQTWEELRVAASKLTVKEGVAVKRAGLALGSANNVANATDLLALMFLQSGVSIPAGFGSAESVDALNFYSSFTKDYKVWDSSMPYSITSFATGQTAMVFANSGQIMEILSINPTLNMGVFSLPQLPTLSKGTTKETWASFWVETVSADASEAQQKAAWDFLVWMSETDQQTFLYEEMSKYQRFGEIPANKKASEVLLTDRFLGPILQQAPNAVTNIVSGISGNVEYIDLFKGMINLAMQSEIAAKSMEESKISFENLQKGIK